MKKLVLLFLLSTSYIPFSFAQEENTKTTFKFGGYIKADFLNTWYTNGDVGERSPLRDFHRVQFTTKYTFGYHNAVADEKKWPLFSLYE